MKKIPVQALFDNCRMMIKDCWGYIWGTAGDIWTQWDQDHAEREMTVKYGQKWVGHHVTDCSGVMVYIWSLFGLKIPHGSSSMVKQGYIIDCGTVPHPGWAALVDDTPDTPDNKHIGIVMEDGITVFEAKGTQAGCVYSKVTDKKWTKFGRFRDVDYSGEEKKMETPYIAEVITEKGSLNVRSGPGTEYGKVGSVPKGARVKVLLEDYSWAFIDYNGLQGYASMKYLSPVEEIHDEPVEKPTETYTKLKNTDGIGIKLCGIWEVVK